MSGEQSADLPAGFDAMDAGERTRYYEASSRYVAACHGLQTGVLWEHSRGSDDGTPKHLRVGVNSAMVQIEALTTLLIERGAFSLVEYVEAQADAMEREVRRYEKRNPGMTFL